MASLIVLYDNHADAGAFAPGFGSWLTALPLTNMQDPRPSRRAHSTDLNSNSTKFRIALAGTHTLRAVAFGPTNYTPGGTYHIRAFSDAAYSSIAVDTGVSPIGTTAVPSLSLPWEDVNFWAGVVPFDDPDGAGVWVIHVFPSNITAQYWEFLLSDVSNPDGRLTIGRLYMGTAYVPTYNFEPNSNRFGFEPLTSQQAAIGGTKYFNRRKMRRTLEVVFPALPQDEVHTNFYRIALISNLDQQVFVIPDYEDTNNINKRSFLGTLSEIPSWQLFNDENAASGFRIVEAL